MAKTKGRKITRAFLNTLAIVSIVGFLAILSDVFFGFNIGRYMPSSLLIILGIGFIVEGQVRLWKKQFKNGISSTEFTHLITGLIGIIAILVGIVGIFMEPTSVFKSTQGILASIAIVVIAVETWVVK